MQLYDMHSHILPDFDDGAKDVDSALKLIDCLKKQGITNICLTPHYYTNELSLADYIKDRNEHFEAFRPHIPADVNVVLGSEVYITHYLFNNDDFSGVTYGKSRYILTEYAYNSNFSEKTMQRFYMMMNNQRLIPVIPHVERYSYLMDNPGFVRELQNMGVIIQTNISNYTSKASFFRKRKLLKMISKGFIDIIGSDAHSFTHNSPELYSEALTVIADKCGNRKVDEMMEIAGDIFDAACGKTE